LYRTIKVGEYGNSRCNVDATHGAADLRTLRIWCFSVMWQSCARVMPPR
jgi:hypothetical protein